jgi:hypothetical protein
VEGGYLELPSCCKNLVAIGQLKQALPSQRFSLTRSKTELFCKIYELDHVMFLDIGSRYDPKDFWELFENFLGIISIGCFTTHHNALNSQIKEKGYWKRFKLGFWVLEILSRVLAR